MDTYVTLYKAAFKAHRVVSPEIVIVCPRRESLPDTLYVKPAPDTVDHCSNDALTMVRFAGAEGGSAPVYQEGIYEVNIVESGIFPLVFQPLIWLDHSVDEYKG